MSPSALTGPIHPGVPFAAVKDGIASVGLWGPMIRSSGQNDLRGANRLRARRKDACVTAKGERDDAETPKKRTRRAKAPPAAAASGTDVSDDARFAEHLLVRHVSSDVFHQTLMNDEHSANRRMWLFGLYALIAHLRASGERVTRRSLSRALECSQASLIGHLDRLAAVGLIVETPDHDPRRRPYDIADAGVRDALRTLLDEGDSDETPTDEEGS